MSMVHVTIQTTDQEKSIAFYEKVVGLSVVTDLRPMGAPIVFMAEGDTGTRIELIQNDDAPYSGSGISVGFSVEDVIAKQIELREAGVETSPLIEPNKDTRFFFVKDPNGVSIQFINGGER